MGKQSTDIFFSLLFHLVSLNCFNLLSASSHLLLLQFLTAVAAEW